MDKPLLSGLSLIANGQRELVAPHSDDEHYDDFQAMAEALIKAKHDALIYEVLAQRSMSRKTYGHVERMLIAGGLTPRGKELLKGIAQPPSILSSSSESTAKNDQEIFQLKPSLYGMSIDLKELWQRIKKWWSKKNGEL